MIITLNTFNLNKHSWIVLEQIECIIQLLQRHVIDLTLSNTFHLSHFSINTLNGFFIADNRKRKIKVSSSAMKNPLSY